MLISVQGSWQETNKACKGDGELRPCAKTLSRSPLKIANDAFSNFEVYFRLLPIIGSTVTRLARDSLTASGRLTGMDNGARDKRLLILAEPCVKTEDAVAIVDQVFLSALTKLRDIAELSAPDNQQRKRSAAPELMCALGTLQIACSHLRVTDPQHTAYPVAGRNQTVSINLLRNIVEQNPDMKIEVWSLLSASDIVSVINHSHKSIPTLLSALNLVHLLSSGTSHEGQDWELANEVRANLVQSGILRAFLDLISIHDGNKDTDFEFPLSVIRITTDCLLLFGHRHFVHDPEHVLTYPRLNRTLWIIVERLRPTCTAECRKGCGSQCDNNCRFLASEMAEQIPFGRDAGSGEEEELLLLPTLIRILSHSPCDLQAFMRKDAHKPKKSYPKKSQQLSASAVAALPRELLLQVGVQQHVLTVLVRLCQRPSIRRRMHLLGGFAPIVTIAHLGAGGRNKTLAQQLVAQMALSEDERKQVAMLEACLATSRR